MQTQLLCVFILTGSEAALDLQQRLRLRWLWHKESCIPLALDVWRSRAWPGLAWPGSSNSCALMGSGFLWCFLSKRAFGAAVIALWEECKRYQMSWLQSWAHKYLHIYIVYCPEMCTVFGKMQWMSESSKVFTSFTQVAINSGNSHAKTKHYLKTKKDNQTLQTAHAYMLI